MMKRVEIISALTLLLKGVSMEDPLDEGEAWKRAESFLLAVGAVAENSPEEEVKYLLRCPIGALEIELAGLVGKGEAGKICSILLDRSRKNHRTLKTIGDVASLTSREILEFTGMGKCNIESLEMALRKLGIRLKKE